jgi:hypothetical protein
MVVSTGWIYTVASETCAKRLASASNISEDAARQNIVDALDGI